MSAHGPKRQFAAVQRYGRCRRNTGRSVDASDTAAPDPKQPSGRAVQVALDGTRQDYERAIRTKAYTPAAHAMNSATARSRLNMVHCEIMRRRCVASIRVACSKLRIIVGAK
jgi:hypothetical protein